MDYIINLSHVCINYGAFEALKDVSLTVGPGVTGLLGPNGSGKTTLIKSLLGLLPVSTGEIEVLGTSVKKATLEVRRHVGYVPEGESYLPGVSAVQFVEFAGELAGMDQKSALKRAHEVLEYVGLREERYRKMETLSFGQRARVKLAQAICHNAGVLILDEPTDGMDPHGQEDFLSLISRMEKESQIPVLLATHTLEIAESLCQSVILLYEGRVVAVKKISDLHPGVERNFIVRPAGDTKKFIERCLERGLNATPHGHGEVFIRDIDDTLSIFQTALELGTSVVSISPYTVNLESIFVTLLQKEAHG